MLVFVGGGTTDGNLPVRYAKAHDQRSEMGAGECRKSESL